MDLLEPENPYYLPTGIRNVLTFGRAVIKILQRLEAMNQNFLRGISIIVMKWKTILY